MKNEMQSEWTLGKTEATESSRFSGRFCLSTSCAWSAIGCHWLVVIFGCFLVGGGGAIGVVPRSKSIRTEHEREKRVGVKLKSNLSNVDQKPTTCGTC